MNNKPTPVLLVLSLLALVLAGCVLGNDDLAGSGNSISETREISDVQRVELEGFGELIITVGDEESVTIEGDDNIVDIITTEVRNGQLTISQEPGTRSIRPKSGLTYRVTVTELDKVTIEGAGDVQLNNLRDDLGIFLNGGGSVDANGDVGELTVEINGAGSFAGKALTSRKADVTISGAGTVRVHASESLSATINGAGTITYSGSPEVSQSINGLGTISAADG